MSLVSATQVMGLPMLVGAHSEDEVQFALDWVTAAAEAYCEREFVYVESDTVYLDPQYAHIKAMPAIAPMSGYGSYPGYGVAFSSYGPTYIGQAMLPNPPITNVSQVLALMPMSGGGQDWVELVNYSWASDGLIWDTTGMPGVEQASGGPITSWPRLPRSLQVVYSHGYATPGSGAPNNVPVVPQGLVSAITSAAASLLVNPASVMSSGDGIITNTYNSPTPGPSGYLLDEIAFAPYRLVNV